MISDSRVSRHHAQLRWIDNQYLLSDLNSSGCTFVNAKQIVQQILIPGDVISLAGFPIIYEESSDIEEISSDRGSSEKVDSKK